MVSWEVIPSEQARPYWGGPVPKAELRIVNGNDVAAIQIPQSLAKHILANKDTLLPAYNTCEELQSSLDELACRVAKSRILGMLERRDHSRYEVLDRLSKEGFDRHTSSSVASDLEKAHLIDDARFAETFIRSKKRSGWGVQRIQRELNRRGVDVERLPGWPFDYIDPDDEYARALEVASRKRVKEPNAFAKLVRFLVGRGFGMDVAVRVAKETLC